MRLRLNGPFRVFDDHDGDVTPKGMKERALLALLVLSPGQRRTRVWLQDKLWSDRDSRQASGSFRQALSNLRKSLGPRLQSDRTTVWLKPLLNLDAAFDPANGDLLDDIDVGDPEFTDWLRLMRATHAAPVAKSSATSANALIARPDRPVVLVCRADMSGSQRSAFILRALSQRIVSGLGRRGDLDVIECNENDKVGRDLPANSVVELECFDGGGVAFVLARVIGLPGRRIQWSGRLAVSPDLGIIWHSEEVTRTVNRTIQAVCDGLGGATGLSGGALMHKAIRRIYEFDRASLTKADELLRQAQDSEIRGLAMAWRGIVRLNEMIEFRENDPDRLAEALDLAQGATVIAPDNSTVLAIASEVTLVLTNDLDQASYYANKAVGCDDEDPEALAAIGRTLRAQNRRDEAHQYAVAARHYAQGMANSFDWDLMAADAKVGVGDLAGAYDLALTGHHKMPFGRHSLRYLTALSLLDERPEDARRFAGLLRRLEPDFSVELMTDDYYPLSMLRLNGLVEKLRAKLP